MFAARATIRRPVPQGAGRRAVRLARSALLAGAALAAGGCYTYTPLYTAPVPGTQVSLELNDRGRVGLEQNVGPEVAVVEGLLTDATDSALVVEVREVRSLYGDRSRWAGERVTIRPDYVRTMSERRYSGARTAVLAGAVASSTLAFLATRSLIGSARGSDDAPPPIVPPNSQ